MKTKEYVKKYRLNENDKFNHEDFVSDLTEDFLVLLEVNKANNNIRGFNNAVNAIRMKFDAVNNKTVGCIPDKLWNYFFATVVAKLREQMCPQWVENKERKRKEWEQEQKRKDKEQDQFAYWFFNNDFIDSFLRQVLKSEIKPTNSFEYLGLSDSASEEEVKNAFRKLSLKHHPDVGGSEKKFIELTEHKNKCLKYLSYEKR